MTFPNLRFLRLGLFVVMLFFFLSCNESSSRSNGPSFRLGLYASTVPPGNNPDFKVLIMTKSTGFVHDSIGPGLTAIQTLGQQNNFAVDATEDSAFFSMANLSQYQCVVFLNTTGDILSASQETSFSNYIAGGGGFVGVHAASGTERNWPWYEQLVGAYLKDHPPIQAAQLMAINNSHPSTVGLPGTFSFTDEYYNFVTDPTATVNVLLTIDETSYSGGTMGPGHPISWFHTNLGGRAWYTNLGHRKETFSDAFFLTHLLGGIRYSASQTP
jgi:cytochrome c